MPRVTTWKIPLALWLLGFAVKIGLSIMVDDTLGTWVGGVLGFLALVTLVMWASQRDTRPSR
jgi:hypothetical protein